VLDKLAEQHPDDATVVVMRKTLLVKPLISSGRTVLSPFRTHHLM